MTDAYSLADLRRIARGETTRAEVDRARRGRGSTPRLGGTIPRAAVLDYAESPEAAQDFDPIARMEGMSSDDIARMQAEELAARAGDRAGRDASVVNGVDLRSAALIGIPSRLMPEDLGEALGPIDQPLAFAGAGLRALDDEFRAWGGDDAALSRQNDRERMLQRAFRQFGDDALGEGDQEGLQAFGDAVRSDPLGALGSLWTGLSPRADRSERVYNDAMARFERDSANNEFARLGDPAAVVGDVGEPGGIIYDNIAPEDEPRRSFDERRFRRAADQALATETLDTASGALLPLEFGPGGIFDDIIAGGANASRAGRLARESGLQFTPDEAARLNRGAFDDVLDRPMTRDARSARNWGVGVTGAGAFLGDQLLDDEASAVGGEEVAGPGLGAALGAGIGALSLRRPRVADEAFAAAEDAFGFYPSNANPSTSVRWGAGPGLTETRVDNLMGSIARPEGMNDADWAALQANLGVLGARLRGAMENPNSAPFEHLGWATPNEAGGLFTSNNPVSVTLPSTMPEDAIGGHTHNFSLGSTLNGVPMQYPDALPSLSDFRYLGPRISPEGMVRERVARGNFSLGRNGDLGVSIGSDDAIPLGDLDWVGIREAADRAIRDSNVPGLELPPIPAFTETTGRARAWPVRSTAIPLQAGIARALNDSGWLQQYGYLPPISPGDSADAIRNTLDIFAPATANVEDAVSGELHRRFGNNRLGAIAGAGLGGGGAGYLGYELLNDEAYASGGEEAAAGSLGALVTGAIMGAAAAVNAARKGRPMAAIRDPETGTVFVGANHGEALIEAEDMAARGEIDSAIPSRLESAYADGGNGPDVGFVRNGRFLSRDETMADLGSRMGEAPEATNRVRENDGTRRPTFPEQTEYSLKSAERVISEAARLANNGALPVGYLEEVAFRTRYEPGTIAKILWEARRGRFGDDLARRASALGAPRGRHNVNQAFIERHIDDNALGRSANLMTERLNVYREGLGLEPSNAKTVAVQMTRARNARRRLGDTAGGIAAVGGAGLGAAALAPEDADASSGEVMRDAPEWAPWAIGGAALGAGALGLRRALRNRAIDEASRDLDTIEEILARRVRDAATPEDRARATEILGGLGGRLSQRDKDAIERAAESAHIGRERGGATPRRLSRLDSVAPRPRGKPVQDTLADQARLMAGRSRRKGVDIERLATEFGVDVVRNRRGRVDANATMANVIRSAIDFGDAGPDAGVLTNRSAARAARLREMGLWGTVGSLGGLGAAGALSADNEGAY